MTSSQPILPPIAPTKLRVKWSITSPVGGSINDTIIGEGAGADGEDEEIEIPFPTTGFLGSVDITPEFDPDNPNKIPFDITQPQFIVSAKLQAVTLKEEIDPVNDPPVENEEYIYQDIPYFVDSLTITSSHPENETWIFPDDFDNIEVPPGTPKEYGGIVLQDAQNTPGRKEAGQLTECGSDGESGYEYLDVFFDYDFEYYPRNSISLSGEDGLNVKNIKNSRSRFPTLPYFPDVVDEDNLKAPILPIDVITSYVADDSESYTITYTIEFKGYSLSILPFVTGGIENPILKITQEVTQDVEAPGKVLLGLLSISNFNYEETFNVSSEELAPNYSILYPYTIVSGFDGQSLSGVPTGRNTIDGEFEGPLQKGDVWYNDVTKERKYYQVNSFVEKVKVLSPGTIYKGNAQPINFGNLLQKNMQFMKALDNVTNNVDTYLDGDTTGAIRGLKGSASTFEEAAILANNNDPLQERKGLTTYAVSEVNGEFQLRTGEFGRGLVIDAVVNNEGGIVRATVVNGGIGYKNGDKVAVYGGDCILEVEVNTDEFWTDEFVDSLNRDKEFILN